MQRYVPWEDDYRPIMIEQALIVDCLHKMLPHHEGMVITSEYPQKNAKFAGLTADARQMIARRWITEVTGVTLSADEYRAHLDQFKDRVQRRFA